MNKESRVAYAEYLAKCLREAANETGIKWPDNTILCVKAWTEIAELDEIIGIKIFVVDIPSPFDLFFSFPSKNEDSYKLLKAFRENLELFGDCYE